MTKKLQMPVPEVVAAEKRRKRYQPKEWREDLAAGATEMTRIVRAAQELMDLAQCVGDAYADLYDAALSRNSNGGGGTVNRPGAPLGDPTGDVATSGRHRRMRNQAWKAARLLTREQACKHCGDVHIRGIPELLDAAAKIMLDAWLEQDPDEQERLRLRRELEQTALRS